MADDQVERSEIATAIEQRERKLYEFDVSGFFGLGDKPIPKLAIRDPMKGEENAAIAAAHVVAKAWAKGDQDTRSDADLLDDLKLKEVIQRCCFVAGQKTKQGDPIQAFYGGKWMEEHFSTGQIAVIHNLILEVRKAESPALWDIKLEDVMALAEGCAKTRDSDMPEALLAPCSREWMTTAFILLAGEWWQAKQKQEIVDNVIHGEGIVERGVEGAEGDPEPVEGLGDNDGSGGPSSGDGAGDQALPKPDDDVDDGDDGQTA